MPCLSRNLFCPRFFCLMGGLFGAAGIASFAASKHLGGYYADFAPLLLGNAPALLIIGLCGIRACLPRLAGLSIALGTLLFTASLLSLQYCGQRLFPYSAPIGGFMAIFGWLLFAACVCQSAPCAPGGGDKGPTLH